MVWMLLAALALGADDPIASGLQVEKGAMGALASWSVANLAVGLPAGRQSDGRSRGFWYGNAGWNAVNLGVAGLGAVSIHRRSTGLIASDDVRLRQQRSLRRVLAVNIGLDAAYLLTGFVLQRTSEREELKGIGDALVLQGGFLLTFDSAFLVEHRRRTR